MSPRRSGGVRAGTACVAAIGFVLLIWAGPVAPAFEASAATACSSNLWYVACVGAANSAAASSSTSEEGSTGDPKIVSRTLDCGPRQASVSAGLFASDPRCATYLSWCGVGPDRPSEPNLHVVATFSGPTDPWQVVCDTPVAPALPSVAVIRAEAVRRAPKLRAATGGTSYLINAAVVFYLTPPAGSPTGAATGDATGAAGDPGDVTIPPFTLAGHTFTIRLHLTSTDWNWGDGTSTSYTTDPAGQPYRPDQPCATLTDCPGYLAHTYTQPGRYTATATAHWNADYTLDGDPQPVPIPGELTTTSTPRTITTRQAHAELVAQ